MEFKLIQVISTYLFRFVDRDMMMRYRGGGVGHKSTRDATDNFLKDRDVLDIPTSATADKDTNTNNNNGEEVEEVEISDGESGENICAGDERKEPDTNNLEDNDDSEDDEDRDEAEFEEEFDYGLRGGDGNDTEDNEEADDEDEDALGPEDGDEEDEEDDDDLGYADL
jgi:hypothetical protein